MHPFIHFCILLVVIFCFIRMLSARWVAMKQTTLKECLVHSFLCSILAKVLNFEVF